LHGYGDFKVFYNLGIVGGNDVIQLRRRFSDNQHISDALQSYPSVRPNAYNGIELFILEEFNIQQITEINAIFRQFFAGRKLHRLNWNPDYFIQGAFTAPSAGADEQRRDSQAQSRQRAVAYDRQPFIIASNQNLQSL